MIVGRLTLVVAGIGTISTLLFRLQQEWTARKDELLRWVERALSLNGAWKWKGRMVNTEFELERVVAEADAALTVACKLRLPKITG
jgi:hypothetical protein